MFIEQPAFLVASLFERKSKPKGKKEREKGRGEEKQRFDPMFFPPPSHPFDKNASLGKNWKRKVTLKKEKRHERKILSKKIKEIKLENKMEEKCKNIKNKRLIREN